MKVTDRPPLGATGLIGESFRLLFRNFRIFFPLAFAPALFVEALNIALIPEPEGAEMQITLGALVAALIGALVSYVIVALLCVATLDAITGTRRGLDAYVRTALPHALPLFVLGTVLSVAAGVALLFFVVPGLYVLAQFLVWVQAAVFEKAGMGALGRAQALTSGYRWPLVGALVLLILLLIGALFVSVPLFALAAAGPARLIAALVSGASVALINALAAIFTTLVYLRLREIEDGTRPADIAATLG